MTKENEKGADIDNDILGYKEKLELLIDVFCIEYHQIDEHLNDGFNALFAENNSYSPNGSSNNSNKKPKFDRMILSPSSCPKNSNSSNIVEPGSMDSDQDIDQRLFGAYNQNQNQQQKRGSDANYDRNRNNVNANHVHRMSLHQADNGSDQYSGLNESDYDQYGIKIDDKLDVEDIVKEHDAFLFICSVNDKQSFVQCIDIINNIKSDINYNYRKPIIIVVTKCDLPKLKHQLSECDIAEFAVDIGVPFIQVTPGIFHIFHIFHVKNIKNIN